MEGKELDKYIDTECWFNYEDFYQFIVGKNYKTFVELGTWKGHSIVFLANEIKKEYNDLKDVKIYGIDLFNDTYNENYDKNHVNKLYEIYNRNLEKNNVRDIIYDYKDYSWEVAKYFEDKSVDFVYIDADHSYDSVTKDIQSWYPKMKSGGIISGHDFNNAKSVEKAVRDYFNNNFKLFKQKVWYHEVK